MIFLLQSWLRDKEVLAKEQCGADVVDYDEHVAEVAVATATQKRLSGKKALLSKIS